MRRPRSWRVTIGVVAVGATSITVPLLMTGGGATLAAKSTTPSCVNGRILCAETMDSAAVFGLNRYVGHDEPSVLFYDSRSGSGNSNTYQLTLPRQPATQPNNDGTGGTFDFQLHPAFWFGMAMCDTQSAPETNSQCTPDSDSNIFDSPDKHAPDWIGNHPGTAFMEMQFYPPGWVNWPPGISCDKTQWCAALNIDSLSENLLTGKANNKSCLTNATIEPVNFAFLSMSGNAGTAANPLNGARFNPAHTSDLALFGSGDNLTVAMHDTAAGFAVTVTDHTSGVSGSMTASTANGFAQVLFQPGSNTCHTAPYAFHPMYRTSSEHTRVPWAAHSYNVAYSDEIGHFESCGAVDSNGNCTQANGTDSTLDGDDDFCLTPDSNTLVQINGCIDSDVDFDGPSYQNDWAGTSGAANAPDAIKFSSPTFNHDNAPSDYQRVAFETDLPRIEAPDSGGICNRTTGANCVNPPPGAQFYPFYSADSSTGSCSWYEGGADVPHGTVSYADSSAEFGPLVQLFYPSQHNGGAVFRYNDFRNVLDNNPCPQTAG